MNCNEVISLLDALVDDELTPADRTRLARHLQHCSSCQDELTAIESIKTRVKQATINPAPESLMAAVINNISNADDKTGVWQRIRSVLTPITTHAGVALVSGFLVFTLMHTSIQPDILQIELFEAHIRSLSPGNLVSVKSSDKHTVKPWFAGKVNYSPPVPELKSIEFPLLGGRIDKLTGQDIAALIYQRRKHMINVFITPLEDSVKLPTTPWMNNGYNLIVWKDSTFQYAAISDISAEELSMFSAKMQSFINTKI